MAITPAGAEVSNAVATNWKKIWKKNLQPLADKRYYTKAQSDTKYQPKGSYETAGSGYTKAETYSKAEADAKYDAAGAAAAAPAAATAAANSNTDTKLGNFFTKAQGDARYAPMPGVIRGTFIEVLSNATLATESISFGQTLSANPVVNIIQPSGVVPAGCAGGTVAAPSAQPGNFCLFLRYSSAETLTVNNSTLGSGASSFGAILLANRAAAGYLEVSGSWAVRPSALAPSLARVPVGTSGSKAPAINR